MKGDKKKGSIIQFKAGDRFILFSDQHRGARDGSDDFLLSEKNYLTALNYYNEGGFHLINLGDSEELWENTIFAIKKHNTQTFEMEAAFLRRKAYTKLFGNHDLYWANDPLAPVVLESIFGQPVDIFEGTILQTEIDGQKLNIFLTHGHQGDKQSDGNWFSKWFISTIWAPLQMYLELNLNTPAYDTELKSVHNQYMYEWVAHLNNTLLITGHTHQPIFLSLTYIERLFSKLVMAKVQKNKSEERAIRKEIESRKFKAEVGTDFSALKNSYFNTGCCCFNDGDITGIEIDSGFIRLIKWQYDDEGISKRIILEESKLVEFVSRRLPTTLI